MRLKGFLFLIGISFFFQFISSSIITTTLQDNVTQNLADNYYCDDDPVYATNCSTQLKWNLTEVIGLGRYLNNATLCLYISGVDGSPDNDINITRILDWTWTEESTVTTINNQVKGLSELLTLNSTTVNTWACLNVTGLVLPDFTARNSTVTFRIFDVDYPAPGKYDFDGEDIGSTNLIIGNLSGFGVEDNLEFRGRENTTHKPTLTLNYLVDDVFPQISILYPPNNTNSSDYSLNINFSATDTYRDSCWWSDDNGVTNNSNPSCLNLTGPWVSGVNNVILWVNDSAGNENSTSVRFIIDSVYPLIDFTTNTENNNTNFSRTWILANVSVTETNEKNITFTLFNQTNQVNSTTYTTAVRSINWTTLPNEIYYYNVTICDIVNQCNSTNTRKLTLDTTNPLISNATMELNNTNFSRSWILLNVTITDTNFKNVTFTLFNTSQVNSTTFTDSTRWINWTNLADGLYYFNATTYDYAGNSNSTSTYWMRLDNNAPVVTLYDPDPITYSDNESIPLNFTSVDATLSVHSCWYQITNLTTNITGNVTLASCANSSFDVPRADTYNFTLWSNDTLGQTNNVAIQFEVDLTAPGISLDYPANTANLSSSTTQINFTATDSDGISQCQLWGNFTGSWALNETFVSITSGVTKTTTKTISDNYYLWGLWCNDTSNNANWALNNQTFTIDTVYPAVSVDSITTTVGSQVISFNSSASDTHLKECKYSIYNLAGGIDGASENVSISCNTNPHSATVSGYATYTLKVYAIDYSGNENSSNLSFTTSATSGTTILGGGGSSTTEEAEDLGYCGDSVCNKDRGETFYTCPDDCSQLGSIFQFENFNLDKLIFNCVDKDKETECFWTSNPAPVVIFISISLIFLFSLLFELRPSKSGTRKRLVYVGPKKKKRR